MKKIAILACGVLLLSCTKTVKVETRETITGEDTVKTTVISETDYDVVLEEEARTRLDSAKAALQRAKDKGDRVAEEAAQKAVEKAEKAWEGTREGLRKGVDKTRETLNKAADRIDSTLAGEKK